MFKSPSTAPCRGIQKAATAAAAAAPVAECVRTRTGVEAAVAAAAAPGVSRPLSRGTQQRLRRLGRFWRRVARRERFHLPAARCDTATSARVAAAYIRARRTAACGPRCGARRAPPQPAATPPTVAVVARRHRVDLALPAGVFMLPLLHGVYDDDDDDDDGRAASSPSVPAAASARLPRAAKRPRHSERDIPQRANDTAESAAPTPVGTRVQCDDTRYVVVDGRVRHVRPYDFAYTAHCKARWIGRELVAVFADEFPYAPRAYWLAAAAAHRLLLNGQPLPSVRYTFRGRGVERVTHIAHRHEMPVLYSQRIAVMHEDDQLLVVNKPASLPVHAGGQYQRNTLHALLQRQRRRDRVLTDGAERGGDSSANRDSDGSARVAHDKTDDKNGTSEEAGEADDEKLFTVHRLDKETSGVVLMAKSKAAARAVRERITARDACKVYIARVAGRMTHGVGASADRDGGHNGDAAIAADMNDTGADIDGRPKYCIVSPRDDRTHDDIADSGRGHDQEHRGGDAERDVRHDQLQPVVDADEARTFIARIMGASCDAAALSSAAAAPVAMHLPRTCRAALCTDVRAGGTTCVDDEHGKPAETHFRPLLYDRATDTTLVACVPRTGRTHQIRVHLLHLGHPIVNDTMYRRDGGVRVFDPRNGDGHDDDGGGGRSGGAGDGSTDGRVPSDNTGCIYSNDANADASSIPSSLSSSPPQLQSATARVDTALRVHDIGDAPRACCSTCPLVPPFADAQPTVIDLHALRYLHDVAPLPTWAQQLARGGEQADG